MFRRSLLAIATVALAIVALAAPASSHVTVNPAEAPRGGFTKLTFRVPTEADGASTVKLEVALPEGTFKAARVQPKAGWNYAVAKVGETVSTITWTAVGDTGIKPGEFDEFAISLGPLPTEGDALVFKAVQTYSDGDVVRWIDEATGDEEVERPAPTVTLTAAADDATTATTAAAVDTSPAAAVDDDDAADDSDSHTGLVIGLVVAFAAIAALAIAQVRGRRS
jgi:uncharacterized protein YcnI